MLVKNWMTKGAVTLSPDRSMMKASKLMKDKQISGLPIVDEEERVVGIVTNKDIKDASPSKATTLDMHELYYLLSEIKVGDIMTRNPVTIKEGQTVEKAAALMLEGHFGSLPVVDEDDRLVGIITDSDVFNVLIDITGVRAGGMQVCMQIPTKQGSLAPVLDTLQNNGARIMSVLTRNVEEPAEMKDLYVRIREMDKASLKHLQKEMEAKFQVQFWVTDHVHPVV